MDSQTAKLSSLTASKGLIIAGYVFAFLGGLIGVGIGSSLRFMGKGKDASGKKVYAYDEASRRHGLLILLLSIVSIITWRTLAVM